MARLRLIRSGCLVASLFAIACRSGRGDQRAGDEITAVGPVRIVPHTPQLATLRPCAALPSAPATWVTVPVTAVPGTIRLPRRLADNPAPVPTSAEQSWADSATGDITLQRDDDAGLSSGFMITSDWKPGTTVVDEGSCAQSFDGHLSPLRRTFWVFASHPADTTFVATTDIPLGGNRQLGAGVIASTRARRDSLLSALASIRLTAP